VFHIIVSLAVACGRVRLHFVSAAAKPESTKEKKQQRNVLLVAAIQTRLSKGVPNIRNFVQSKNVSSIFYQFGKDFVYNVSQN
jgi:hypothetical protein